jgi:membrane-associated protein
MENFWEHLQNLTDARSIISKGGFFVLLAVVFAETGLFFGFFLPGDYLLFSAGLLCASGVFDVQISTLIISLIAAGVLGNYAGYWFGYRTGPVLFSKDDSILFKKRYVIMAEQFFVKYGGVALILGRFFPIIRTFAPIFAGVVKVDLKRFSLYNFVGSIAWVTTLCLSGYYLGIRYPAIKHNLQYLIIGFLLVTAVPFVIAYFRKRANKTELTNL